MRISVLIREYGYMCVNNINRNNYVFNITGGCLRTLQRADHCNAIFDENIRK